MESFWFPIDIIYEIIQYCDINTLLEIALTSRDCQYQAESLIYRTISFSNKGFFDPDGDLDSKFKASELVGRRTENCVESLAAHPDKACHIRELQLEFEDRTQFYDCDPMFGLIDTVLLAATQLEVLKLQFEYDPDEWVNGIALLSALQRCTFSLKTIVVRDSLDPVKWARFHDNLQEVRFDQDYRWYIEHDMISVYQDWTAQSSYRLIVWALIPRLSSLYIIAFPVLNPYWSAQPIRESLNDIAPSLKDHDDFVPDQLSNVVLVVNSITEQTLIDNIKSLNESFPAIKHLQLEVEKAESYQPPTVLYTALSLLPRLTVLTFCLLEGKLLASRYVSLESELQLADLWTKSSPELREIFFLSGNTLVRDKESRIWRLHSQAAAESEEE